MRKLLRNIAKERLALMGAPKRNSKGRSTFPYLWREVIFGKLAKKAKEKQIGRE